MKLDNIKILVIDKFTCDVAFGDSGFLDTEMLRAKKVNDKWLIIKEPKVYTWVDAKTKEKKEVTPYIPRGRQWTAIAEVINEYYKGN